MFSFILPLSLKFIISFTWEIDQSEVEETSLFFNNEKINTRITDLVYYTTVYGLSRTLFSRTFLDSFILLIFSLDKFSYIATLIFSSLKQHIRSYYSSFRLFITLGIPLILIQKLKIKDILDIQRLS